jgi:hypothetical protein
MNLLKTLKMDKVIKLKSSLRIKPFKIEWKILWKKMKINNQMEKALYLRINRLMKLSLKDNNYKTFYINKF